MTEAKPYYVLVAEALGVRAEPELLRDRVLLYALVSGNSIQLRSVGSEIWEASVESDAARQVTGRGDTEEAAVWDLVLKLKELGLLKVPSGL